MDAKDLKSDVKNELTKAVETLGTLRDEAKLHLHLATLDAKQEWDEKLEPRIAELQSSAVHLTESSRTAVQELVTRVEGFVSKLRGRGSPSANP